MGKIPVSDLIAVFRTMYTEHWSYIWGHAETGCVDCSGAFVYAYKQFGHNIAHGSNTIAREYTTGLMPISKAAPGMAAFKCRDWRPDDSGNRWYGKTPGDLYHIGLVDESGQYVLNAQGEKAGFTRTPISKWAYVGYLKAVDYGKEEKPMQDYIVTADNGLPVRVRNKPSKDGKEVCKLKCGVKVQAAAVDSEWMEIQYGSVHGFMMSKFLVPASEEAPDAPADGIASGTFVLTQEQVGELCNVRDELEKLRSVIVSIVGEG